MPEPRAHSIDWSALVVVAASLVLGCASRSAAVDESKEVGQEAVKNGTLDKTTTSVVAIVIDLPDGYHVCSGTLILPNLVLTAQHCVATPPADTSCSNASTFGAPYDIAKMYLTTDSHWDGASRLAPAELWRPSDHAFCGGDQALILLAKNVDPAVAKPLVPRIDEAAMAGEVFDAVGFGVIDDQGDGSGIRHRKGGFTIQCVGAACKSEFVTDREWSSKEGHCAGDSGAPALDAKGRVIGVVSRGFGACGGPILGQATAYADWIKQQALEAAKQGGYEAPAWVTGWPTDPAYSAPIGAACKDDTTCAPGLCEAGVCTRLCNDKSPCAPPLQCLGRDDGKTVCRSPGQGGAGGAGGSVAGVGGAGGAAPGPSTASEQPGGCSVGGSTSGGLSALFGVGVVAMLAQRRRRRGSR